MKHLRRRKFGKVKKFFKKITQAKEFWRIVAFFLAAAAFVAIASLSLGCSTSRSGLLSPFYPIIAIDRDQGTKVTGLNARHLENTAVGRVIDPTVAIDATRLELARIQARRDVEIAKSWGYGGVGAAAMMPLPTTGNVISPLGIRYGLRPYTGPIIGLHAGSITNQTSQSVMIMIDGAPLGWLKPVGPGVGAESYGFWLLVPEINHTIEARGLDGKVVFSAIIKPDGVVGDEIFKDPAGNLHKMDWYANIIGGY